MTERPPRIAEPTEAGGLAVAAALPAPGGVRPWLIWAVGLSCYLLAIFHRTSLAVAGLTATHRFGISAAQLSTFTVLQLLVYAGMQIPVGLLVDRFGPRSVLFTGVSILSLAQTGFALAQTYPEALAARTFVGMGDAMTWICVVRLIARWFGARRVPVMNQLSGSVGQLGAIAAAIPMTIALSHLGWTAAYLIAAAVGPVVLSGMLLVVHDSPTARRTRGSRLSLSAVRVSLARSWTHPGTRLGFWMHFTTQFSATTLTLLWGYPFFVQGEGRSKSAAGLLLTLLVVAYVASGPILGVLTGRHPWHRSTIVLCVVAAIVSVWTAVLLWPGPAPYPLLVLLVVVVGVGGPASVIGFDLARTSNPAARLASATGIVNQAGFLASLILVLAIGLILDRRTPSDGSGDYAPSAFRWAMSAQYVLWAVGSVQIWRYRVRARRVVDRCELQAGVPIAG